RGGGALQPRRRGRRGGGLRAGQRRSPRHALRTARAAGVGGLRPVVLLGRRSGVRTAACGTCVAARSDRGAAVRVGGPRRTRAAPGPYSLSKSTPSAPLTPRPSP